jgi:hypothetical protein
MFEGPKNEYKHINRDSEEFEMAVQDKRKQVEEYNTNFIFSEKRVSDALGVLEKIKEWDEIFKDSPERLADNREMEEFYLAFIKRAFLTMIKHSSVQTHKSLVSDIKKVPGLLDKLNFNTEKAQDPSELDSRVIESILRQRLFCNAEREELIAEKWEDIMQAVTAGINRGVDEGIIKRDSETVEKIFSKLEFGRYDPLFTGLDAPGMHSTSLQAVEIASDTKIEALPHIVIHELLHSLSGTTILSEKKYTDDGEVNKVKNKKIGFSYIAVDSKDEMKREKIFDWLNEGVTEEISMELSGMNVGGYVAERRKLKRLYELGIDREIIYNAYFEDYNPDDPERVPHWKKFVAELKRIFPDLSVVEALEKVSNDVDEEIRQEKSNEEAQS